MPTHVDKERVRYFQDDDSMNLKDLVKNEKMRTAEDQNSLFMRMASKVRCCVYDFLISMLLLQISGGTWGLSNGKAWREIGIVYGYRTVKNRGNYKL